MGDELDLRKKAADGERAAQLLKDTTLKSAIDAMKKTCFDNFVSSSWQNEKEREALHMQMNAITHFEDELRRRINDGKVANSMLSELKDKIKSFI